MLRRKRTPQPRAREQSNFEQALLDHWRAAVQTPATRRSEYPFCPGQMHWRAVLDAAAQLAEAERLAVNDPRVRPVTGRRSPSTPTG